MVLQHSSRVVQNCTRIFNTGARSVFVFFFHLRLLRIVLMLLLYSVAICAYFADLLTWLFVYFLTALVACCPWPSWRLQFSVTGHCVTYGTNQGGWDRSCHDFEILRALVFPEWYLCRGHPAVQGYKRWRDFKKIIHISWPHRDVQVEVFQVGVILEKLNFVVALRLICQFSTFLTQLFFCNYLNSPWFSFFW